jgi:hypothetical protein
MEKTGTKLKRAGEFPRFTSDAGSACICHSCSKTSGRDDGLVSGKNRAVAQVERKHSDKITDRTTWQEAWGKLCVTVTKSEMAAFYLATLKFCGDPLECAKPATPIAEARKFFPAKASEIRTVGNSSAFHRKMNP